MKLRIVSIVLAMSLCVVCAAETFAGETETLQQAWAAYNVGRYKDTLRLLQPLASNGNPTAQILIGRCYENGLGVPQNMETAAKWYALAAEQNVAQAQVLLGYCYEHGLGVPKDTQKTLDLMKKAAQASYAEAQFNLSMYYSKGLYGLPKDFKESFSWAMRAAEQGYAQAERYVGACYENGVGVHADPAKAQEWYAKAAAKGLGKEGTIVNKRAMPE